MNRAPLLAASTAIAFGAGIQPSDLLNLRSVGIVQFSPDGSRLAYTVIRGDGPGRPFPQIWVMALPNGNPVSLSSGNDPSGNPVWSPNGAWVAFNGKSGDKEGLFIAHPDGSGERFLASVEQTNSPLSTEGNSIAWSPDNKQIAYVSAQPGPDSADVTGDPVVIKTYHYKPGDQEGNAKFNDNKRWHIFIADVATGHSRQLTSGANHEHSIDWSPDGKEIAFAANPEPRANQLLNYALFAIDVSTGAIRRLTVSEGAGYRPRFSPDGRFIAYEAAMRGVNGLAFSMENLHVWLMNSDGTGHRELTGTLDNRHQQPMWAQDGGSILLTVQERGDVHLYQMPVNGGKPAAVVNEPGCVTSYSAHGDQIAFSFVTPEGNAELFLKSGDGPAPKLTNLNGGIFKDKKLGRVEAFSFISNDHKWNVEAFLTYPADFQPDRKYPVVVTLHGGPHGQQGAGFNFKNQVYAAHGFATLMVNYRGSTGYGQAFTDAAFRTQNGDDAQDVLYAVNAAMGRYLWIDRDRLGIEGISYGGQLGAWLITQTSIFKAAVLTAPVTNLVSFSYGTNYRPYEQIQWGKLPHQDDLLDWLWEHSAVRRAAGAKTPTLLIQGEDDNDVPIGESEQFYMALLETGTDAVMVRYPREGHGLHEPKHVADAITRSLDWYGKYMK